MITLTVHDERLLESLRTKSDKITAAVSKKLNQLDLLLQRKIVTEKLSGQVLQHRTGTLAGSIRAIDSTISGTIVTGSVEGGGGPAWYGRIHEYGGTFSRKAGAVKLRTNAKGELLRQGKSGNLAIFAKSSHKQTKSVAFGSGTVTFPERSFMRSSLSEMRPQIVEGLRQAVGEGLKIS